MILGTQPQASWGPKTDNINPCDTVLFPIISQSENCAQANLVPATLSPPWLLKMLGWNPCTDAIHLIFLSLWQKESGIFVLIVRLEKLSFLDDNTHTHTQTPLLGLLEHELPILAWQCNKPVSAPDSDVLIFLASLCIRHTDFGQHQ